jgi:hypothetical protein
MILIFSSLDSLDSAQITDTTTGGGQVNQFFASIIAIASLLSAPNKKL